MEGKEQLDEIVSSFRRISHSFQQLLWKDAEQLGITPTQLMAIRKLSEYPDMSVSELAERLYLGNSAVSGIVERMVRAGLITRRRSEDDRRMFRLSLTETGGEMLEKSKELLRKHLLPLTHISPGDAQDLLRIHGQIIHILGQERGTLE